MQSRRNFLSRSVSLLASAVACLSVRPSPGEPRGDAPDVDEIKNWKVSDTHGLLREGETLGESGTACGENGAPTAKSQQILDLNSTCCPTDYDTETHPVVGFLIYDFYIDAPGSARRVDLPAHLRWCNLHLRPYPDNCLANDVKPLREIWFGVIFEANGPVCGFVGKDLSVTSFNRDTGCTCGPQEACSDCDPALPLTHVSSPGPQPIRLRSPVGETVNLEFG